MAVDTKELADQGSVLSRWSRRKLEAEQSQLDTGLEATPESEPATSLEAPEETPPLTDADMPDVDALTEDSDFSGFMSSGVSDKLRNLALRKLFHTPVFNIRDGLDEYDEDYTSFEPLGDIVTCDMKHQIEVQEQKAREALEQENEALDTAELDEVEDIDDEDDAEHDIEAHSADDSADDNNQQQPSVTLVTDDVDIKPEADS